jgi:hypothetical protein
VDDITIELPADYRVESLPPPQKIDAKGALLEATTQSESRSLRFHRRFTMEVTTILVRSYGTLRSFYDKVKTSDEEKVVLETAAAAQRN